jgi:23S rRNA pseudouridine1911/1915/1917 synthase
MTQKNPADEFLFPYRIEVLYEDNHTLSVAKPVGLQSQSSSINASNLLDILKTYLKIRYNKPGNVYLGLVHRLDTRVSGIVLLAKTSKAFRRLSGEMRKGEITKRYVAVVIDSGQLKDSGTLIDSLDKQSAKAVISGSGEGKVSQLSYTVLERKESCALVAILLHTGRFHQIRAQFSHVGAPVFGDYKYGYRDRNLRVDALALHSYQMKFAHPIKGTPMEINSSIPDRFPFSLFATAMTRICFDPIAEKAGE